MNTKQLILIILPLIFSGCISKSNIKIVLREKISTDSLNINVANVQVINNQVVITGTNLNGVTDFKIKNGATVSNLQIESKSDTSIIANTVSNMSFAVGTIFDFVFSNANASSVFQVAFTNTNNSITASMLTSMGATKGQIMKYNGASWVPSSITNAQTYLGTYDATANNPDLSSPSSTPGDYFIVSVAGTLNSIPYAVGDWIISDGYNWQKVANSAVVVSTYNGRRGIVITTPADYVLLKNGAGKLTGSSINDLADVNLATPLHGSVLKYDSGSGKWIVGVDNSGGGAYSGPINKAVITDGTTGALTTSATTSAELGFVAGVTSSIQTQLNTKQTTTLTSGNMLVGSAGNVATGVAMSGDATLANTGAVTLKNTGSAGTYTSVTTDAQGRVTAGTNPVVIGSISGTAPVTIGGTATAPIVSMAAATTAVDGYLLSSDWNIFNNKQSALSAGPTINGIVYPANGAQTLTIPLAPVSLTDAVNKQYVDTASAGKLTSTLSSGSFLVGSAGNVATGVVMSGDATLANTGAVTLAASGVTASTYNSVTVDAKGRVTAGTNPTTLAGYGITDTLVTGVSVTAPLTNTGTAAVPLIGMPAAATAQNGYLTSADWNTFSGKQSAITSATALNTGSVTTNLQGGVVVNPFGTNAGETGEIRFNELVANGVNYVGLKSPDSIAANLIFTLPSADGSPGQILKTDGAGVLSWVNDNSGAGAFVGAFNKAVATDGAGALTTIATTATELGYVAGVTSSIQTQLNAKQTTTLTSGSFLVGSAGNVATGVAMSGDATLANTGAITLKNTGSAGTYTSVTTDSQGRVTAGTNPVIVGSISGTAPVTIGGTATAPIVSMAAATTAVDGYLLSSDWNIFNNKQSALSAGATINGIVYPANGAQTLTVPLAPVSLTDAVNKQYVDTATAGAWSANVSGDVYRLTGNVGIGTTAPANNLDVTGNADVQGWMAIGGTAKADGGVSNPILSVYGNLDIVGGNSLVFYNGGGRTFFNAGGVSSNSGSLQTFALTNANGYRLAVNGASAGSTISSNGNASIGTTYYTLAAPTNGMIIEGNVGVGTTSPQSKLDVNGSIKVGVDATACSATIAGAMRFNTPNIEYCNGSAWTSFNSGSLTVASANITDGTIMNTDINASAAIDATKIGAGTVSNTAFGYLSAVTSDIQAQLNAKQTTTLTSANFLVGSAGNIATGVAMSGDATLANTGAVTLKNTGSAGTYTSVTTDAQGRVTAGTNPVVVGSISGTAPVTIGGTATAPIVSMAAATTADDGYLLSSDWNIFNNKQSALSAGATINGIVYPANGAQTLTVPLAPVSLTDAVNKQYVDSFGQWTTTSGNAYRSTGNVGIGNTTPSEKLDVTGNIRASGQISSGSSTTSTAAIDWNNGNAFSSTYNCAANHTMANLRNGGTYTLVATDTGTTQCNFSTTTTGTDAGTVSYRFKPANAARTASSHTVYTLMRVGTVVYVSWASGF